MRLGVLATHPIQYQAPLYRALAQDIDLHVYFAHRQTAEGQADAGFGVEFEWDTDLTGGYAHTFLANRAAEPGPETFSGCNTPEIRDIIERECFDAFLVPGWYTRSYWQAMMACWRTKTPLLVRGDSHLGTPRSSLRQATKALAYRTFIPRFDAYLTVGQRNREYYLHYGASPDRMFAVPHFVDTEHFARGAAAARLERRVHRQHEGLNPEGQVLLFAGKFIDVKRPLDFVETVARLSARDSSIEGAMVGDGPLRADIEAAIAQTQAPIRLLGFRNQSEMPKMYALADALALPSAHETWGLVVNEAQACGLPVVATNSVGCAPDLIDEAHTGFTFEVGNLNGFEHAAGNALEASSTAATESALKILTQRYSLDAAVTGTLQAVKTVSAVRPSFA